MYDIPFHVNEFYYGDVNFISYERIYFKIISNIYKSYGVSIAKILKFDIVCHIEN